MYSPVSEFIENCLLPVLPPKNPLRRDTWSGLAFDRNRYENFAPDDVWSALFSCHIDMAMEPKTVGVVPFSEVGVKRAAWVEISADLASLQKYWTEDFHFLKDHFVFSLSQEWIVRLDQDVTLFAGDGGFMNAVVAKLGGSNRVTAIMEDDFSPGVTDEAGLRQYIKAITRVGHR